MSKSDFVFLECGCIILNGELAEHCVKHYENQATVEDPLWNWLVKESKKKTGLELKLRKHSSKEPVAFEFFNDGKKDIIVRTTDYSSKENPKRIQPLELKTLYLRPGGFMKLWDYESCYHLLVE